MRLVLFYSLPSPSPSPFRSSCSSSSKTQWSRGRSGRLFAKARFPNMQTSYDDDHNEDDNDEDKDGDEDEGVDDEDDEHQHNSSWWSSQPPEDNRRQQFQTGRHLGLGRPGLEILFFFIQIPTNIFWLLFWRKKVSTFNIWIEAIDWIQIPTNTFWLFFFKKKKVSTINISVNLDFKWMYDENQNKDNQIIKIIKQ